VSEVVGRTVDHLMNAPPTPIPAASFGLSTFDGVRAAAALLAAHGRDNDALTLVVAINGACVRDPVRGGPPREPRQGGLEPFHGSGCPAMGGV
jgi:hypothetical protein